MQVDKTNDTRSSTKVKGKFSYGWIVAVAGAVGVLAACNFLYTFGVFVKPLLDHFGWSRAAISFCVSIRNTVTAVVSPIAGILADRLGPRKLMLTGILVVGVSYLLASRLATLWQLYLILGILTGIGIAVFFVPTVATVTRWFGGKSTLANAIVYSGFGWAQIILPPVATYLILQYGWERCFIILGLSVVVLGALAWSFIRTPSSATIELQTAGQNNNLKASETPTGNEEGYTLSRALRTRELWTMFLILLVSAATFQMVVVHIIAAAIDIGATPEAAAIIVTLNGITNTLGRLTLGGLATKIGNKTVLVMCLATQALALFALSVTGNLNAFYVIAAIHGLAYGAVTPIIPSMTGSYFGTVAIGSLIGSLNAAYTSGAATGPFLGGYIFDVTGGYTVAFVASGAAITAVFILSLMLKPPQSKAIIA